MGLKIFDGFVFCVGLASPIGQEDHEATAPVFARKQKIGQDGAVKGGTVDVQCGLDEGFVGGASVDVRCLTIVKY
jgi:hypothetical protein